MERISYSIISRGAMLINYSNNVVNLSLKITGVQFKLVNATVSGDK